MSQFNWQTAIAIVIVAAAAVTLMRRIYGTIQGSATSSCGSRGCGSCAEAVTPDPGGRELPLVTLESALAEESSPAAEPRYEQKESTG